MSVTSIADTRDKVLFATDTPADVDALLQQAVALYDNTQQAESTLWQAFKLGPDRLEVYVALYKFYFYKNLIEEAQSVVMMSLRKAAELGGFNPAWEQLTEDSCTWTPAPEPQRQYLYSLKALAFINLRQKRNTQARAILDKLKQLDPEDQVGASVIEDLAEAMNDD